MVGPELQSLQLGDPLLDEYLAFVGARARRNTWLAVAFDLKVFFSVVGKPPAEVQGIVLHRVLPGEDIVPGAGVQFIAADDEFRARLDAYLEKLRNR